MNKTKQWLIAIFVITIIVRLILAFSVPNFTYESYFHLRQVEHISETGLPLYEDSLSYGGRELRFLPFFHYFIAFFDLFLPLEFVAKVIPNILIATLPLLVYAISTRITQDETSSLFAAFIAGFLPILYSTNKFGVESLFLPLVFLTIYAFLRIKEPTYLYVFILAFLISALTSSLTFLIIVGLGVYLLLSLLERKKIIRAEIEVILFSVFFYLWVQFLFFKKILIQGTSFVWQGIPFQIIQNYFPQFSLGQAVVLVSAIPFLAGIYVVYQSLFRLRNTRSFLIISLVTSTTLLTWARVIPFKLSLSFFAISLAILFAPFYKEAKIYLRKTKIAHHAHYLSKVVGLLLVLTTVVPAIGAALQQETPNDFEIEAFIWFKDNTPKNSGVLALLEEGHLITYYAKRRNLMDDMFALAPDAEQRFIDMNPLFTTSLQTNAVSVLEKYDIEYLIYTPYARKKLGNNNFNFLSSECFKRLHEPQEEIKRYQAKCTLEKQGPEENN